jgi:hypothetical protein
MGGLMNEDADNIQLELLFEEAVVLHEFAKRLLLLPQFEVGDEVDRDVLLGLFTNLNSNLAGYGLITDVSFESALAKAKEYFGSTDLQIKKANNLAAAQNKSLSIEDEWQRAESLAQVARGLASAGQLDYARKIWREAIFVARAGECSRSPQESIGSSSVLWEIAEDMALAGEIECAERTATSIKNEHKRQRALHFVADIVKGGKGSFYKLR